MIRISLGVTACLFAFHCLIPPVPPVQESVSNSVAEESTADAARADDARQEPAALQVEQGVSQIMAVRKQQGSVLDGSIMQSAGKSGDFQLSSFKMIQKK